eukprot:PhF_6_TR43490/c0_g1_i1/m.66754/K07889/RAB5C; Ras-related protein Rab-5C
MSETVFKIVVVGEASVGKSSLAYRFVKNEFDDFQEATVGAACLSKLVTSKQGNMMKIELWDTAGQERYRTMAPLYYRNARVALILYDVTNSDSLTKAESWIQELREKLRDALPRIILVGNKRDLPRTSPSCVASAAVEQIVKSYDIMHFETSAKTGEGVSELFDSIILGLDVQNGAGVNQSSSYSQQQATVPLSNAPKTFQKKKKCC